MKVAVILSGCGYLDGAEIRESVLSLLYLDMHGADVSIFAPDKIQHHVIDHYSAEASGAPRHVLQESARIARGEVTPLSALDVDMFDALVIPGGFGVAKNLSDFAFEGNAMTLDADIKSIIQYFHKAGKPIGAICIAPVIVAAALSDMNITITIGDDIDTASAIMSFGNIHQDCATDNIVVDEKHKIITCSAYMRDDAHLRDVAKGIEKLILTLTDMVKNSNQQAA